MSANTTGAYATYWISEDTRRMCFKHGVEVNQDTDYESDNMSKPEIRLHSYWVDQPRTMTFDAKTGRTTNLLEGIKDEWIESD